MEQISRPYQIALGVLLVFALLWFVALRPKNASTASSPGPAAPAAVNTSPTSAHPASKAQTSLGRDVAKARAAHAQETASGAASSAASDAAGSPSGAAAAPRGSATAPKPAAPNAVAPQAGGAPRPGARVRVDSSLPRPVRTALAHHRVLVLLFFNRRSPVDRDARREVLAVPRERGHVVVVTAPISRLSSYAAITQVVPVLGSPTVVIVDPRRRASTVTGRIDRDVIEQEALKALSAGAHAKR